MPSVDLESVLLTVPALLIGLTFHEYAHALVAFRLGDPTAKNLGRLTLNPLKHLDPLGAIFLLIFKFGWAKPVPVNPLHFSDRQRGMLWVSLAGPGSNLVIAVVAVLLWKIIGIQKNFVDGVLLYIFHINVILAVFNVIPVPPLDGSKILAGLLPRKYSHTIFLLEKYGFAILLLLMFTGIISRVLIPIVRLIELGIAGLVGFEPLQRMLSFM